MEAHIAINRHRINVAMRLLPLSAINARDIGDTTPLLLAVSIKSYELVESMLRMPGLDVNAVSAGSLTAFVKCGRLGNLPLAQLLSRHRHIDINHDGDRNHQGYTGKACVHEAAANGSVHLIMFLIQSGALISTRDVNGWTPLHHGVANRRIAVIKLLLDNLSLPAIQTESLEGVTPLMLALELKYYEIARMIESKSPPLNHRVHMRLPPHQGAPLYGHGQYPARIQRQPMFPGQPWS
uniref:ANK_REP_REGION domain-containing protein n=1 Tax=Panagrellus redivivus TaxID=6233 RepID=A0A7E4VAK0_PANRE